VVPVLCSHAKASDEVAGNTPDDDDDPFAYLYRSETRAPSASEQHTQQFDPVAAEQGWVETATRLEAPDRAAPPGYGAAQYQGYAPGPGEGGKRPGGIGGFRAAALTLAALVLAGGLGTYALVKASDKAPVVVKDQPGATAGVQAPPPVVSQAPSAPASTDLETTADKLQLTGGAALATDHKGYTGAGFVGGLEQEGAGMTWAVEVPEKGRYRLDVRYANATGKDLKKAERKIGLQVNGKETGQLRMPVTGSWDSWGTTWRNVTLKKGRNEIVVACRAGDSCHVNIDTMSLSR
jgi:Carbohydrate binding module (family 6)